MSASPPRFPFRRLDPLQPPAEYAEARAAGPLFPVTLWNGRRAWLVTRHEEIRAILTDDARFTGAMADPNFPTVTEARVTVDKNERAFVGMDNPAHDHYRRMFTREFSYRRMEALKPRITAIADDLIDALEAQGPPADLVSAFAVKFPSLVMSALLGSPYEDHPFIIECAVARHGLTQTPQEAQVKARDQRDLPSRCKELLGCAANALGAPHRVLRGGQDAARIFGARRLRWRGRLGLGLGSCFFHRLGRGFGGSRLGRR